MAVPDAASIAGLLADGDRRQVFAAIVLGASSVDTVVAATSLPPARVTPALARLVSGGIVTSSADSLVVVDVFQSAARQAHQAAHSEPEVIGGDVSPATQKVLRAFVSGGRLQSIPAVRSKRLVVLDWLAQEFEIGRRYSEKQVNLILGQRHADSAALRRYLVDEGYLDREGGEYWRSGGTT